MAGTGQITIGALRSFTGTCNYYRWMGGLILTDGAHYLARNGAAWILDILASVRGIQAVQAEYSEFWSLTVDVSASRGTIVCTDGGKGENEEPVELYRQDIPFTDFPLPELTLYVVADPSLGKVVLLPSEY